MTELAVGTTSAKERSEVLLLNSADYGFQKHPVLYERENPPFYITVTADLRHFQPPTYCVINIMDSHY